MSKLKPTTCLPAPARYFPITGDRYSTRAGLSRFGTDFGNGELDTQLFQFDHYFHDYRSNKLAVRTHAINDYVCTDAIKPSALIASSKWLLRHLCLEHPDKFSLQKSAEGMQLDCSLTGDTLLINSDYSLLAMNDFTFNNLFDALALQVQEDICLMQVTDSSSKLMAAHLCAANHWSAHDKLQMDMPGLHKYVPGFADDNRDPDKLLQGIANKIESYVRFAWGLCEHAILNQHPNKPPTPMHKSDDRLFMRIERQVIWPIANTDMLLFTIRTYFRDCAELAPEQRSSLMSAVNSMSEATLKYKNIDIADVLNKLN